MATPINSLIDADLQQAAAYRALQHILRRSTLGLLLCGGMALAAGVRSLNVNPAYGLLLGLGGLAFVQIGVKRWICHPLLLLSEALLLVGTSGVEIWLYVSTIATQANGEIFGPAIGFQAILGVVAAQRFRRYRHGSATPPPVAAQQRLEELITAVQQASFSSDPALIEFETYGVGQRLYWKARLEDTQAILVDRSGALIEVVRPSELSIKPAERFNESGQQRVSACITLRRKRATGQISIKGLQRFLAWQQRVQGTPGQLWVPSA